MISILIIDSSLKKDLQVGARASELACSSVAIISLSYFGTQAGQSPRVDHVNKSGLLTEGGNRTKSPDQQGVVSPRQRDTEDPPPLLQKEDHIRSVTTILSWAWDNLGYAHGCHEGHELQSHFQGQIQKWQIEVSQDHKPDRTLLSVLRCPTKAATLPTDPENPISDTVSLPEVWGTWPLKANRDS